MIIGISGKIGSGKDTAGAMIQFLIDHHALRNGGDAPPFSLGNYNDWYRNGHSNRCIWKIKKYADSLKNLCCLLTGCTREQLESSEFKNSPLPAEWEYLMQWTGEAMVRQLPPHGYEADRIKRYTYREFLQYIGTELFRNQLHENTWVNALMAQYNPTIYRTEVPVRAAGYLDTHVYPKWIITDVRFSNEAKAIKAKGGIVIRIERPSCETKTELNNHASEIALDRYPFDRIILNDAGLD